MCGSEPKNQSYVILKWKEFIATQFELNETY